MTLQKTLSDFWSARAARERRVLLVGGVLLAMVMLYLVLIAPAADGVLRLQRLLPQTRARAAQLDALVTEAKSLRSLPQAAAPSASDARAALDKSLDAAGLKSSHSEPLANGDLRLSFVNVPFGKWTAWLAASERTMGVHAVAAKIKATGTGAAPGAGPTKAGSAPDAATGSAGHTDIELTLHLLRAS